MLHRPTVDERVVGRLTGRKDTGFHEATRQRLQPARQRLRLVRGRDTATPDLQAPVLELYPRGRRRCMHLIQDVGFFVD